MHQIFETRQDRRAKPYTFGIVAASNWMWSIALEKSKDCFGDVYSLRNLGLELARISWVNGKLAIGYGKGETVVPIRVNGEFIKPNSSLSRTLPCGSLIRLRSNGVIEVQSQTALAQWLGTYTRDLATIMTDRETLAIAHALGMWRNELLEFIPLSTIAQAVFNKLVTVTGQEHVLDTVCKQPEPLWLQPGQVWQMEGASDDASPLLVTRTFEILEVGLLPDPSEESGYGNGAIIVHPTSGAEVFLPHLAFEKYATLLV